MNRSRINTSFGMCTVGLSRRHERWLAVAYITVTALLHFLTNYFIARTTGVACTSCPLTTVARSQYFVHLLRAAVVFCGIAERISGRPIVVVHDGVRQQPLRGPFTLHCACLSGGMYVQAAAMPKSISGDRGAVTARYTRR